MLSRRKRKNQKVNPSNFDHLHVTNAYVQLNSERYPEENNLNINFSKNHFVKSSIVETGL